MFVVHGSLSPDVDSEGARREQQSCTHCVIPGDHAGDLGSAARLGQTQELVVTPPRADAMPGLEPSLS
jgi:hypothetical protein